MTIEEWHKWFDEVIDKTESPYFTSAEKDAFFNRAQESFVTSFFRNPYEQYNQEKTSIDVEALHTIIPAPVVERTDSRGRLQYSIMASSLPTDVMYILGVARRPSDIDDECGDEEGFRKSRFVRHNDYWMHQQNSFKEASEKYPVHRYFNSYLKFSPEGRTRVSVTVVRYPVAMTLDDPDSSGDRGAGAVDCELPAKHHNEIIFKALVFAGIPIREGQFYEMISQREQQE